MSFVKQLGLHPARKCAQPSTVMMAKCLKQSTLAMPKVAWSGLVSPLSCSLVVTVRRVDCLGQIVARCPPSYCRRLCTTAIVDP
jgi:hypothetical protein